MSDEPRDLASFGFGTHPTGMPAPLEDFIAYAGSSLADGEAVASQEALTEAMKTVFDPEIPVDIYELGLIYRCEIDAAGTVSTDMSLTAPGCPVAGILPQQVADALAGVNGVGEVSVQLVWDPAWTSDRMSADAKLALDIG